MLYEVITIGGKDSVMILEYEIYKKLYNFPIMAKITVMDQGCVVIIIGGSRTHTGTVSMYKNEIQLGIIQRKEHKDQYISEKWAKELSGEMNEIVYHVCAAGHGGVRLRYGRLQRHRAGQPQVRQRFV